MPRVRLVLVLVLTLLCVGATTVAAAVLADATVDIVDSDYQPGSITINAGETVTWTQNGEQPHTVTADDGTFDSGRLAPGETFSMRFDSPGTYRYHCTLHGGPGGEGMSAVVIVEGAQTSDDPPSVDPEEDAGEESNDEGDRTQQEDTGGAQDPGKKGQGPALPRTGGGPPPLWVFALAVALSGVVLWKVARLTHEAEHL